MEPPARQFYRRLGFEPMADWLPYRARGAPLRRLAEDDSGPPRGNLNFGN
ncbi:MAG: hypothetical protein ACE5KF_04435 [Kiloniellaceae bacterium]